MAKLGILIRFMLFAVLFLLLFNVIPENENLQYDSPESHNVHPPVTIESTLDLPHDQLSNENGFSTRNGRYIKDIISLNDAAVQLTVMSEDESDNAYHIGGGTPLAIG